MKSAKIQGFMAILAYLDKKSKVKKDKEGYKQRCEHFSAIVKFMLDKIARGEMISGADLVSFYADFSKKSPPLKENFRSKKEFKTLIEELRNVSNDVIHNTFQTAMENVQASPGSELLHRQQLNALLLRHAAKEQSPQAEIQEKLSVSQVAAPEDVPIESLSSILSEATLQVPHANILEDMREDSYVPDESLFRIEPGSKQETLLFLFIQKTKNALQKITSNLSVPPIEVDALNAILQFLASIKKHGYQEDFFHHLVDGLNKIELNYFVELKKAKSPVLGFIDKLRREVSALPSFRSGIDYLDTKHEEINKTGILASIEAGFSKDRQERYDQRRVIFELLCRFVHDEAILSHRPSGEDLYYYYQCLCADGQQLDHVITGSRGLISKKRFESIIENLRVLTPAEIAHSFQEMMTYVSQGAKDYPHRQSLKELALLSSKKESIKEDEDHTVSLFEKTKPAISFLPTIALNATQAHFLQHQIANIEDIILDKRRLRCKAPVQRKAGEKTKDDFTVEIEALEVLRWRLRALQDKKSYHGDFYQHIRQEVKAVQAQFPNGFKKHGKGLLRAKALQYVMDLQNGALKLAGDHGFVSVLNEIERDDQHAKGKSGHAIIVFSVTAEVLSDYQKNDYRLLKQVSQRGDGAPVLLQQGDHLFVFGQVLIEGKKRWQLHEVSEEKRAAYGNIHFQTYPQIIIDKAALYHQLKEDGYHVKEAVQAKVHRTYTQRALRFTLLLRFMDERLQQWGTLSDEDLAYCCQRFQAEEGGVFHLTDSASIQASFVRLLALLPLGEKSESSHWQRLNAWAMSRSEKLVAPDVDTPVSLLLETTRIASGSPQDIFLREQLARIKNLILAKIELRKKAPEMSRSGRQKTIADFTAEIDALDAIRWMLRNLQHKGYQGDFYQAVSRNLSLIESAHQEGFQKHGNSFRQAKAVKFVRHFKEKLLTHAGDKGLVSELNALDEEYARYARGKSGHGIVLVALSEEALNNATANNYHGLKAISQNADNAPLLIQQGDKLFIFGFAEEKKEGKKPKLTWQLKEVTDEAQREFYGHFKFKAKPQLLDDALVFNHMHAEGYHLKEAVQAKAYRQYEARIARFETLLLFLQDKLSQWDNLSSVEQQYCWVRAQAEIGKAFTLSRDNLPASFEALQAQLKGFDSKKAPHWARLKTWANTSHNNVLALLELPVFPELEQHSVDFKSEEGQWLDAQRQEAERLILEKIVLRHKAPVVSEDPSVKSIADYTVEIDALDAIRSLLWNMQRFGYQGNLYQYLNCALMTIQARYPEGFNKHGRGPLRAKVLQYVLDLKEEALALSSDNGFMAVLNALDEDYLQDIRGQSGKGVFLLGLSEKAFEEYGQNDNRQLKQLAKRAYGAPIIIQRGDQLFVFGEVQEGRRRVWRLQKVNEEQRVTYPKMSFSAHPKLWDNAALYDQLHTTGYHTKEAVPANAYQRYEERTARFALVLQWVQQLLPQWQSFSKEDLAYCYARLKLEAGRLFKLTDGEAIQASFDEVVAHLRAIEKPRVPHWGRLQESMKAPGFEQQAQADVTETDIKNNLNIIFVKPRSPEEKFLAQQLHELEELIMAKIKLRNNAPGSSSDGKKTIADFTTEIDALHAVRSLLRDIQNHGYQGDLYQQISLELHKIQERYAEGFKRHGKRIIPQPPKALVFVENLRKGALVHSSGFMAVLNYLDEKYLELNGNEQDEGYRQRCAYVQALWQFMLAHKDKSTPFLEAELADLRVRLQAQYPVSTAMVGSKARFNSQIEALFKLPVNELVKQFDLARGLAEQGANNNPHWQGLKEITAAHGLNQEAALEKVSKPQDIQADKDKLYFMTPLLMSGLSDESQEGVELLNGFIHSQNKLLHRRSKVHKQALNAEYEAKKEAVRRLEGSDQSVQAQLETLRSFMQESAKRGKRLPKKGKVISDETAADLKEAEENYLDQIAYEETLFFVKVMQENPSLTTTLRQVAEREYRAGNIDEAGYRILLQELGALGQEVQAYKELITLRANELLILGSLVSDAILVAKALGQQKDIQAEDLVQCQARLAHLLALQKAIVAAMEKQLALARDARVCGEPEKFHTDLLADFTHRANVIFNQHHLQPPYDGPHSPLDKTLLDKPVKNISRHFTAESALGTTETHFIDYLNNIADTGDNALKARLQAHGLDLGSSQFKRQVSEVKEFAEDKIGQLKISLSESAAQLEASLHQAGYQQSVNTLKSVVRFFESEEDSPAEHAKKSEKKSYRERVLPTLVSQRALGEPLDFDLLETRLQAKQFSFFPGDDEFEAIEYLLTILPSLKNKRLLPSFLTEAFTLIPAKLTDEEAADFGVILNEAVGQIKLAMMPLNLLSNEQIFFLTQERTQLSGLILERIKRLRKGGQSDGKPNNAILPQQRRLEQELHSLETLLDSLALLYGGSGDLAAAIEYAVRNFKKEALQIGALYGEEQDWAMLLQYVDNLVERAYQQPWVNIEATAERIERAQSRVRAEEKAKELQAKVKEKAQEKEEEFIEFGSEAVDDRRGSGHEAVIGDPSFTGTGKVDAANQRHLVASSRKSALSDERKRASEESSPSSRRSRWIKAGLVIGAIIAVPAAVVVGVGVFLLVLPLVKTAAVAAGIAALVVGGTIALAAGIGIGVGWLGGGNKPTSSTRVATNPILSSIVASDPEKPLAVPTAQSNHNPNVLRDSQYSSPHSGSYGYQSSPNNTSSQKEKKNSKVVEEMPKDTAPSVPSLPSGKPKPTK